MELIKTDDGSFDLNISIEELMILKIWSTMDDDDWHEAVDNVAGDNDPHIRQLWEIGFYDEGEMLWKQRDVFRRLEREIKRSFRRGELDEH